MSRYYPVPVTAENLEDTWRLVDQYRIRAKQRRVSCLISLWAGGLCFCVMLLLCLCGLLYAHRMGPFYSLFRNLLVFHYIWDPMSELVPQASGSFLWDFLTCVLALYWITMVVMALFYGLPRLIYHPRTRPVPAEESTKNLASGLLANAREAMEAAARIRTAGWFVFPFLFFLGQVVILILCISRSGDPAPLMAQYMTRSTPLNYLILFLTLNLGFTAVYGLLVYALWSFCRMKLHYSFVADIECYSFFCTEKNGKLSYPEILAKRKAAAAETRQSALAAERAGAYPKAASMLLKAAHGGDPLAMEHYARHCLISENLVPAKYWLRRCAATGEASKNAKKMLRRVKMGMPADAAFLREEKQEKTGHR